MQPIQLPSPLESSSTIWYALALAGLATALALAWWRQRHTLLAIHHEAAALREQVAALKEQHALLEGCVRQRVLVAYRCAGGFDGPVLQVGAAIEQLAGWPRDVFLVQGMRLAELIHPDDRLQVLGRLAVPPASDTPLDLEFRLQHRNGAVLWVSAHCAVRHGADGIQAIEGTLLDVDRHKASAQLLLQRTELYSSLITSIPGAAYRCTPDERWTVVFVSDAVERLSGWTPADYLASPTLLRDLLHPDERERVVREIQAANDEGRGFTLEYRAVHRDGHVFWAWEQGKAVRDAHGRVLWLDGVIVDISESKAMETALREAKSRAEAAAAAKTAFLANMGHEVRTPLNAIIGFSEIVLRNELDTLQRQYVFKVRQAATALLRLMNDILDMAKHERNPVQDSTGDFSLRAMAQDALAAQRHAADAKGLALRLDAEPGLADEFQGDAARLRQVLDKLLDNAVKFTHRGSVRLQLARQQGQVLLAVHDTGIGIAAQDQERIFEPFSQLDDAANRRFNGTGLGIPLARQLVERMGGSLGLHSAPGQGSVFRVLVPLAEAARAGADHRPAHQPPAPAEIQLHDGLLQAFLQASPGASAQPWRESLHATVTALRNGDQGDANLAAVLQSLRGDGLDQHAVQVERALAQFDLDRAAELLESLPARL